MIVGSRQASGLRGGATRSPEPRPAHRAGADTALAADVIDVFGMRVVVGSVDACYCALGRSALRSRREIADHCPKQPQQPDALMLPNFFVVGAPKAGTTSLYDYLDQHPSVYMSPIKEPAFFAADLFEHKRRLGIDEDDPAALRAYLEGPMTARRSGVIGDWEQYLKLLKNVRQETAVGEASGNYLGSSHAPVAIRERIPHARIVMLLRDPVERLYSQYSQAASEAGMRLPFLPWVEKQQALEAALEPRLGAVWNGLYAEHVQRYLVVFPPQQLRIHRYEDFSTAPLDVLRDLFAFLGVDPHFRVAVSRRHNVSLRPGATRSQQASAPLRARLRRALPDWIVNRLRSAAHRQPARITPAERAAVLELYVADIRELQRRLRLDLAAWLSV